MELLNAEPAQVFRFCRCVRSYQSWQDICEACLGCSSLVNLGYASISHGCGESRNGRDLGFPTLVPVSVSCHVNISTVYESSHYTSMVAIPMGTIVYPICSF